MNGRSDCKYAGHCLHEADGVVYQRHNARPVGNVDTTCCWCGEGRQMSMYAKAKAGTPEPNVQHGKFLERRVPAGEATLPERRDG